MIAALGQFIANNSFDGRKVIGQSNGDFAGKLCGWAVVSKEFHDFIRPVINRPCIPHMLSLIVAQNTRSTNILTLIKCQTDFIRKEFCA